MSLVALKMRRVGLDHTAILQEQQSRLLRGHVRNKGLGPLKSSAKAGQDVSRVDWFGGYQRLPVGSRMAGIAPNLCDKAFWGKAR
jgi:hypothetical protein